MVSPADVPELHGSHLKFWRVYEHAWALQAGIERWRSAGGYKFKRTVDDDGWHHVTMRFNALPSERSLLMGECVQNMRNSLDNLEEASRLLRRLPDRPLSEPSVALLTRQVKPGTNWAYPDPEAEPVVTYTNR